MSAVIYFIQRSNGDVKIGTTKNIRSRISGLKREHGNLTLLGIIKGSVIREKILHWCLSDAHVEKEWFTLTPEIQGVINDYASMPPEPEKITAPPGMLSIEQVEKIMGWSYPTALKFASRHGEMIGGKWQVLFKDVKYLVDQRENDVIMMRYYLNEFGDVKEPANA